MTSHLLFWHGTTGAESQGEGNLTNLILLICSSLAILPWLSPLPGQEDTMLVQLEQLDGRLAPKALLDTVTFEQSEITLEEALDLLVTRGNLNLSFNRSRLPLGQMVSLQAINTTALDALLSILEQTATELVITTNGQLVVIPSKADGQRP